MRSKRVRIKIHNAKAMYTRSNNTRHNGLAHKIKAKTMDTRPNNYVTMVQLCRVPDISSTPILIGRTFLGAALGGG